MSSAIKASVLGLLCLCAQLPALAQAPLMPYQEYEKRIKSAQNVGPLGSDLFGESISLYNGSTEFAVTDIDLPGNNALPVRLGRRFTVSSKKDIDILGGFGNWDLEVPYIHGIFIDGWMGAGRTGRRCSEFQRPLGSGAFEATDFWSGTKMYIPGQGDQDIMLIGNLDGLHPKMKAPADGHTYRLGTKNLHRIRCKTNTANGFPGEAFIAVDSNGTTMTFDWSLSRAAGVMEKITGSDHGNDRLGRTEYYLMLTRMQDRFGNWVTYQWNGEQLQSITSSDGRSINIVWNGRTIVSASAHGRTWTYQYGHLGYDMRVVLPDNSWWGYQDPGVPWPNYPFTDYSTNDAGCQEPFEAYGPYWLKVTHPSGAIGQFDFQYTRHRRTGIPVSACYHFMTVVGTGEKLYQMGVPDYFDVYSITNKSISGPGVATQNWTYGYDIPPYGRAQMDPSTPLPCSNCQDAKSVFVTQPDGNELEYRFGTLWYGNDGRLLATYVRDANRRIARAEINRYVTDSEAATMPFPDWYGASLSSDDGTTSLIRPVKTRTIAQDGAIAEPDYYVPPPPPPPPPPCDDCPPPPPRECDPANNTCLEPMRVSFDSTRSRNPKVDRRHIRSDLRGRKNSGGITISSTQSTPAATYTREVNSFDEFARPTQAVRSNSIGHMATDTHEYHNDLSRWVLGQSKRSTTNGVESSRTEFNASALPWKTYSFGNPQPQQTFGYNLDGTLASVTDARNQTTFLSQWKRGTPQRIQHPDGKVKSAVVDEATGWITSATDEGGSRTCYQYDGMGRITRITSPAELQISMCDTSAWNPTVVSFEPVNGNEYGISAGHWRQTVSTGNGRKMTYFDALWRPLLVREYDSANEAGTQRFTRYAYDHEGRVSFASYPGVTHALTAGIWTEYDVLGRTTSVSQDSEHGLLITRTVYLPDLKTRVTNPRGLATTTSFMAYDQPGYDWPVWIQAPEGQETRIQRDVFGKTLELTRGVSGQ